ncbi:MAG TPA: GIY-YIG nuclease family protein [Candidatus Didemnitutus sp.]|jgi:putative endonuclease
MIMPAIFPTIPCPESISGHAWVYILQSADGSLYIGQTVNLPERLRKHRLGLGSKHTRDHEAPRLIYCEGPIAPNEAVARESQLKRWSRAKKEALIRGDTTALRQLSQSCGPDPR